MNDFEVQNTRYVHDEAVHNLRAPREIVPFIIEALHPKSVIDVGGGFATFAAVFCENGIRDIFTIDGSWVDPGRLHISPNFFRTVDLEQPVELGRRFDLAVCLEVAEHLPEKAASTLVASLCRLSDVVVFSAAIRGQGGQNHVNEQPFEYWQRIFKDHEYDFYDVFRPRFWANENVDCWYKQNMFLVVKNSDVSLPTEFKSRRLTAKPHMYIHPELFALKVDRIRQLERQNSAIMNGEMGVKATANVLRKAMARRFERKRRP